MQPSNCQIATAGVTSDPVARKGSCLVLDHFSSQTLPFPSVAPFERLLAVEYHGTARVSHRAQGLYQELVVPPWPSASRRLDIPQSRLLEREPGVSLESQANAGSLHYSQKADGSQANPFGVRTSERKLFFPPESARPPVLPERNPLESPCAC